MFEAFDAYHKWLGIPPAEQPPDHYRLLGIGRFETDQDVIEHAADRQMAHVRTLATGKHSDLSQRILNELASARVCLLNSTAKVEYDQELRSKLAASRRQSAARPKPSRPIPVGRADGGSVADGPEEDVPQVDPIRADREVDQVVAGFSPANFSASSTKASSIARRNRNAWHLPAMVGALVVVALVVTLILLNGDGTRLADGTSGTSQGTDGRPAGDNDKSNGQTGSGDASGNSSKNPGKTIPDNLGGTRVDGTGAEGTKIQPQDPPPAGNQGTEKIGPTKMPTPQEAALEMLRGIGAKLEVSQNNGKLRRIDLGGNKKVTDAMLATLVGLDGLVQLDLTATRITAAGLVHVGKLVTLQHLELAGTEIGDDGLANLRDLKQLTRLGLKLTRVSGAGLPHLGQFERLRTLDLSHVQLTDGALQSLAFCRELSTLILDSCNLQDTCLVPLVQARSLEVLSLVKTSTTDTGLAHLRQVKSLKRLILNNTKVTAEGVAQLQMVLPNCKIDFDARGTAPPITQVQEPKPEPTKTPIPDEAAMAKALDLIRNQIYKDKYAAARKPPQMLALAQELMTKARETRDDPVARYALLQESRRLAADGCGVRVALLAVTELENAYDVDVHALEFESLSACAKSPLTAIQRSELAEIALERVSNLVQQDLYPQALQCLTLARTNANRSKDTELTKRINARLKAVHATQKEFDAAAEAEKILNQDPDNPEANFTKGRFLCFTKDQWDDGLPLLAKGSDDVIQAAARLDLTQPTQAAEQATVGDGWWDAAENVTPALRLALQARAVFWYRMAATQVTGLQRDRLDIRIAEYESSLSKDQGEHPVAKDKKVVFLSTMLPDDYKAARKDWFAVGVSPIRNPKSPITVDKTPSPHGIFLHPPRSSDGQAYLRYSLNKKARLFRTEVALDDGAGRDSESPMTFEVWGDGALLWKSDPVKKRAVRQQKEIKVLGVTVLELRVGCAGGNGWAHAVWLEPHVVLK